MLIEVFADFSCPWCFIGRRRLARAQALRPHLPIEIVWQPFRLNPELPPEGMERRPPPRGNADEADRRRAMERALVESGRKDGIAFLFDRIDRTPNTLAAHRLVRFSSRFSREMAMADALFSAYFEQGLDIGDPDTLVDLAVSAGLDRGVVAKFLPSDEESDAVMALDELVHQSGIAGVPYFIFNRRYALAGAQEPASFLPLFDAVAETSDETLISPV
jgi:predicted DsbA family dithiol-disulfide isomerase